MAAKSVSEKCNITVQLLVIPSLILLVKYGERQIYTWVRGPTAPMHLGLISWALCASIANQGSPAALLKLQIAPRLMLIMSSGSKKEPRYVYLIEAKVSHRQRMWK
jgi:hypothetical protein